MLTIITFVAGIIVGGLGGYAWLKTKVKEVIK